MRRLREAIRLKRQELWANNSWLLHHDNASSHTALVLRDHFVKNSTYIVLQPPYSPDLASCDFWLLPNLKTPLRETRFESIDETKAESKKTLMAGERLFGVFQGLENTLVQDAIQFEYVSNCALSSGAICLKILQFDCLSLCHVVFFFYDIWM